MPDQVAPRISIRVSSFPHHVAPGSRWTLRGAVGAVLGLWVVTAALLGAVLLAIAWDLRP
jgi:hypothetical protein